MPHCLGHRVGLEVHAHPTLDRTDPASLGVLREGMLLTIEPGVYTDTHCVRIEDVVRVGGVGERAVVVS